MKPIEGQPGMFRMDDGRIYNIKDFIRFETSDRLEGIDLELPVFSGWMTVVQGWRLTTNIVPSALEQQQLVTLWRERGEKLVEMTVQSLLSIPGTKDRDKAEEKLANPPYLYTNERLKVLLRERPIEGCGLRVHLYGLTSKTPS